MKGMEWTIISAVVCAKAIKLPFEFPELFNEGQAEVCEFSHQQWDRTNVHF